MEWDQKTTHNAQSADYVEDGVRHDDKLSTKYLNLIAINVEIKAEKQDFSEHTKIPIKQNLITSVYCYYFFL